MDAVLGVWCTRYMAYLVYAVLGVCCARCMHTRCQLMIMTWRDREDYLSLCSTMIVKLWTRKREMGDEDGYDVEHTS